MGKMFSELVGRVPHMPPHVEWFEVNELASMRNPRTCQEASHNSLGSRIGRLSPNNGKILLKTILVPANVVCLLGLESCGTLMQKMVAPDTCS